MFSCISYHWVWVVFCLLFDLRYHLATFHIFALGVHLTEIMFDLSLSLVLFYCFVPVNDDGNFIFVANCRQRPALMAKYFTNHLIVWRNLAQCHGTCNAKKFSSSHEFLTYEKKCPHQYQAIALMHTYMCSSAEF